jgi:hypothetical protein
MAHAASAGTIVLACMVSEGFRVGFRIGFSHASLHGLQTVTSVTGQQRAFAQRPRRACAASRVWDARKGLGFRV